MMSFILYFLTFFTIALVGHAEPQTATPERLVFTTFGNTAMPVASIGNYVDYRYLPAVNVPKVFTVPWWAADNDVGQNGVAKIGVKGGNILVCAESAMASRCGTPQTDLTQDISNGTAYDFNVYEFALEPIGGSRITSITVLTPDVSGTGVWMGYTRSY